MSRADLGLLEDGFTGQDYPVHTPQEVAAAIAYLVSDLARGVNGSAHVPTSADWPAPPSPPDPGTIVRR